MDRRPKQRASEQTGTPGPLGANTTTNWVTICPTCARREAYWGWLAGLALAALLVGGVAILIYEFAK